ncbi:MAG: hypothetical protein R2764_21610 [Bacteroidales bacterium]
MRNEIFKKIQQSRNEYYSELRSRKVKKEISDGSIQQTEIKSKENNSMSGMDTKNDNSKSKINLVSKSKHKAILPSPKTQQVAEQLWQGIDFFKQQLVRANRKVKAKSDKLAEGFYDFSSRIFDDKYNYEKPSDSGMNPLTLITPSGQTLEWEITYPERNRSILDEIAFLPIEIQNKLKHLLIHIMFWFNADEIMEIGDVTKKSNSAKRNDIQFSGLDSGFSAAYDFWHENTVRISMKNFLKSLTKGQTIFKRSRQENRLFTKKVLSKLRIRTMFFLSTVNRFIVTW